MSTATAIATATRSSSTTSSAAAASDPKNLVIEAVKKVQTIATLPEVTSRIVATVEDPKSTASQLHRIVSHDPALVTRILKVVNSAFYGLPGQIGSIERAIRSEERRVGKECRCRWSAYHEKKKSVRGGGDGGVRSSE